MAAFDLLGRRMAMSIVWELRSERLNFRELQSAVGTNPGLLNTRLTELRAALLVEHDEGGYTVTAQGKKLIDAMMPLLKWSQGWAKELGRSIE